VIAIATIRACLIATLIVGLCAGCWEPEYSAEELNASGMAAPAPVQPGVSADGCVSYWQFPDDFELKVDFETMMAPADGFQLGELAGYVHSDGGTSGLFIRAGHADLSMRSLLFTLGDWNAGYFGLSWWGCLDVSTRRGIRFWAKGTGAASVQPSPPKAPPEGECVPELAIDLTEDWQMYEYTWDRFCPSGREQAFAQKVTGIRFLIQDTLVEPWIAVDDVSFID